MKKLLAIILVLTFVFSLAACGGTKDPTESTGGDATTGDTTPATDDAGEAITDANGNVLPSNLPEGAINAMRETFDSMEYTTYMNVFQDTSTKQFDGVEMTKVGTFAILQDEWSGKLRYYVWGFADQTRCCDFQWEFIPEDVNALPNPGAYIRVKGTFTYTEDQKTGALDHYWLTDTKMDVLEDYTASKFDYDLTVMSATLARVQLFSIQNYTDKFADKTMLVYGRVLGPNTLQHPYYDNSWNLDFKTADDKTPGIGQYLVLGGRIVSENGGCWLEATTYQEV